MPTNNFMGGIIKGMETDSDRKQFFYMHGSLIAHLNVYRVTGWDHIDKFLKTECLLHPCV